MDAASIGKAYLNDFAAAKSAPFAALGGTSSAGDSSFELMLRAAAKAQSKAKDSGAEAASAVPAVGRPLGAAANSLPADENRSRAQAKSIDRTDKLYEQCRELESFLIKNLLSGLRKTVQKSEFLGGGFAGEMYEDMLYDEYAKNLSRNAGFGLADQAYLELSRAEAEA